MSTNSNFRVSSTCAGFSGDRRPSAFTDSPIPARESRSSPHQTTGPPAQHVAKTASAPRAFPEHWHSARGRADIACSTILQASGGTSGRKLLRGIGRSPAAARAKTTVFDPTCGCRPLSMKYIVAPTAKTSLRSSVRHPSACSGDMYAGVPTMPPVSVKVASDSSCTRPKSIRTTCILPADNGAVVTMMLLGLTSRCTKPRRCTATKRVEHGIIRWTANGQGKA